MTVSALLFSLCKSNCLDVRNQQQDLIRRIDSAVLSRETSLVGYTVIEYYTIKNSHFRNSAEATVETTYQRGVGKTYNILSRSGPSLLQTRVLERLLHEEARMTHGKAREQVIVTSANYDMKLIGRESLDSTICDVIELTPKRRSPYLLKGRMWVDATDTMLHKIEGRPPTSASVFEGRPQIVREYKEINGFALAVHNHAVSTSFLWGQSTVDIEYRDYHVVTSMR